MLKRLHNYLVRQRGRFPERLRCILIDIVDTFLFGEL